MRSVLASTISSLLLSGALLGCATNAPGEENPLPENITEGAADSWSHPTDFGFLYGGVWQRGNLDPSSNRSFPAWKFNLSGDAKVTITTRVAPSYNPDVKQTVVYLYKQTEEYNWKRIARTGTTGLAKLTRNLSEGSYQVIVKGRDADATGDFMLRSDCVGEGCAEATCLFGDGEFHEIRDLNHGSLVSYGSRELTVSSQVNDAEKAQIIDAVRQSTHDDVTTLDEAFAVVDGGVINRYGFFDDLAGRSILAFEYGAGDNSFGAFYGDDTATPVATIGDGYISDCTVTPRACIFGQIMHEAAYMPDMTQTSDEEYTSEDVAEIPATIAAQIVASQSYEGHVPTLAEALDQVDDGEINVSTYKHADGREFTEIQWYGGDNPVGVFYRGTTTEAVAQNGDGDLYDCTEF